MKKTMHGPGGLKLDLNTDEVNKDDPGAGTPALVRGTLGAQRGKVASFECARDTGELDCGGAVLDDAQRQWLNTDALSEYMDRFLYGGFGRAKETAP